MGTGHRLHDLRVGAMLLLGWFAYRVTRTRQGRECPRPSSDLLRPAHRFRGQPATSSPTTHPLDPTDVHSRQHRGDKTFYIEVESHRFSLPSLPMQIDCQTRCSSRSVSHDLTTGSACSGGSLHALQMQVLPPHQRRPVGVPEQRTTPSAPPSTPARRVRHDRGGCRRSHRLRRGGVMSAHSPEGGRPMAFTQDPPGRPRRCFRAHTLSPMQKLDPALRGGGLRLLRLRGHRRPCSCGSTRSSDLAVPPSQFFGMLTAHAV